MTEAALDQAAGLRRLLAQSAIRTITVTSAAAGAGRSLITANLAVALARQGRGVLVLDCASGRGSAGWLLGAQPGGDLLEAARGVAAVEALVGEGVAGVRVAQAGALVAALGGFPESGRYRLAQVLETLRGDANLLLVDGPPADLVWGAAAGEAILLVGPGPQAMTDSYRLIKRLSAQWGRRRIHVLVNGAHSPTHADRIFGNLSATSRRFLNLPLESVGRIPDDERMVRAARLRQTVVEAFPEAGCARALSDCAESVLRWNHPGEDGFTDFAIRLVETARMLGSTGH
jgi:flagellar biosynthesis protein FlhG